MKMSSTPGVKHSRLVLRLQDARGVNIPPNLDCTDSVCLKKLTTEELVDYYQHLTVLSGVTEADVKCDPGAQNQS